MLRPPRSVEPAPSHEFVTLDEALQLAALEIEEDNLALRRDQAGAALLYVSGMRAGALGSLPLEAVDVTSRTIKQWPSLGVRTKIEMSPLPGGCANSSPLRAWRPGSVHFARLREPKIVRPPKMHWPDDLE